MPIISADVRSADDVIAFGGPVCQVGDFPNGVCATGGPPPTATFIDFASAFSAFSFALTTHTSLPPILTELERPTPTRSGIIINAMTWFSSFLYIVTGAAGYLLFGNKQCPVITNAFGDNDIFIQVRDVARSGAFSSCFFFFPVVLLECYPPPLLSFPPAVFCYYWCDYYW